MTSSNVVIEPHRRGGWEIDISGPTNRRVRVDTRAQAERLARESLTRPQVETGTFVVRDAYHRIVTRGSYGLDKPVRH
jgi:hypothetical protein